MHFLLPVITPIFLACLLQNVSAADFSYESPHVSISISAGCIISLVNKLTGEQFADNAELSGFLAKQPVGVGQAAEGKEEAFESLSRHRPEHTFPSVRRPGPDSKVQTDGKEVLYHGLSGGQARFPDDRLSIIMQADGNDIILSETGILSEPGAYCISLAITGIPDSHSIIAPVVGGQCFSGKTPAFRKWYEYIYSWEAPLVILQGKQGGVAVWCDDPLWREKKLSVEHSNGLFNLVFMTMRDEGVRENRKITSANWHISAYRGNWTVPAKAYRTLMEKRWNLKPLQDYEASWVRDIKVLAITQSTSKNVDKLAALFEPETVLIYNLMGTRNSPPDSMNDTRFPHEEYKKEIDYARSRGFHVIEFNHYRILNMPGHPNSHYVCPEKRPDCGCTKMGGPEKLYELFLPYLYDRYGSGKGDVLKCRLGFVHTGFTPWRKMVMDGIEERINRYNIDGFYLDTSGCPDYHPKGPVEGLNNIAGSLRYWQELRKKFPMCVFMSEGVTETSVLGAALGYRSHAFHSLYGETEEEIARQSRHPVSSYLFSPFTWGYLPLVADPSGNRLDADILANETLGCIPSFSVHGVPDPSSDPFLLKYAQIYSHRRLSRVYPDEWEENTVSYYRDKDGRTVKYIIADDGDRMVETAGKTEKTLLGRFHGVTEALLPQGFAVPSWPAYRDGKIIGMLPEGFYPYLPMEQTRRITITEMPPGTFISEVINNENFFFASLKSQEKSNGRLSFTAEARPAVIILNGSELSCTAGKISLDTTVPGELVVFWKEALPVTEEGSSLAALQHSVHTLKPGGFEKPVAYPAFYGVLLREVGGVKKKAITARPEHAELIINWMLRLPSTPCHLSFSMGVTSSNKKDVFYLVRINGEDVFAEKTGPTGEWQDRKVDLSRWAGKTVLLSLVTQPVGFTWPPGPDAVYWGEPVLEPLVR